MEMGQQDPMPVAILTIVLCLLMLAVGTFAFYVTNNEVGFTEQQTEYFTVTNPSVNRTCSLEHYPDFIISVHQWNGHGWVEVPSVGYSVNYRVVEVDHNYMEG